jgi:hypothetical protein
MRNQILAVDPPFDSEMVRAVAHALSRREAVPADPLRDLDPEAFAYLARYWHVAPSLWLRLRDCPTAPAIVRDQLRAEYWRNIKANTALRAAASDLFVALNAQGVVPMLLKGGCQLFDPPAGHVGTRFMVDLDLLVPPGQDGISFDTLRGLGFVPAEGWDTEESTRFFRSFHHWPKLTRPDDGLVVEIHRTPWLGGGTDEAEAFFASSTPIQSAAGAGNARLPCAAHRLLHNAVHAFEPGLFRCVAIWDDCDLDRAIGCTDLRQLLDFVELCSFRGDELDWGWLLAEADRFGHKPELQQWAYLARTLFGVSLPDGLAAWNADRPEWRPLRIRCRIVAKRALHRTGLLGPVRRWKSTWVN